MRKELKQTNAIPSKRLYQSIIADYNPKLAICELIDNSIDLWVKGGKKEYLRITVNLNINQQSISVIDNAGGINELDIKMIIAPGYSSNTSNVETIGVFGVGSKRAVVALAQEIKIRTRYKNERTLLIEYNDEWLEKETWDIEYHLDSNDIDSNCTIIELTKLRLNLEEEFIEELKEHTGATYSKLLEDLKLDLYINQFKVEPIHFDSSWSYPPNYFPQKYKFNIDTSEGDIIQVEILGGLISKNQVGEGEYGVYFYCNNRLILRADKSYNLGFSSGQAGLPHPSLNMLRVFVYLSGRPERMPWNSSKAGINFQSKIFQSIREKIIQLIVYYAKLARRFSSNTEENIYQYSNGTIDTKVIDNGSAVKLFPIPAPIQKKTYESIIKENNKSVAEKKPWVIGLYEGIILADNIINANFENKNRFALIIIDSTLEIALKEFLVHVVTKKSNPPIGQTKLVTMIQNRTTVEAEVKKYLGSKVSTKDWTLIDHYYKMRCNLIHQVTTSDVRDSDIIKHRSVVERLLDILFKLKF